MAIHQALKDARERKGFTGEEVAKALGYKSKVSYYNIENGVVDVTLKQAKKLSEILQQPIDILFPKFFKSKVHKNRTIIKNLSELERSI